MSRYIDAEYVKAVMLNDRLMQGNAEFNLYAQQVEIQVKAIPSIDIVFCKECKYFIDNLTEDATDEMYDACRWDWKRRIPNPDDFCSYGEVRDE